MGKYVTGISDYLVRQAFHDTSIAYSLFKVLTGECYAGERRASVTVYRVGVATLYRFVSFSLAIPYHMEWDLSTPFFNFSEILFRPSPVSCSRVLFRVSTPLPVPTRRPSRCPVHAPPVPRRARLRAMPSIDLSRHRGGVYTVRATPPSASGAVITSQPLVLFPPSTQLHQQYRTFRLTTDTYRIAYHTAPLITKNSPQSRINTVLFAYFTPTATLYTHYPIETPIYAK